MGLCSSPPQGDLLYCTSLDCALQILCVCVCVRLNKLKVCGNSVSSKSISAIFQTAFAYFVSLHHFLVASFTIVLVYGDL